MPLSRMKISITCFRDKLLQANTALMAKEL
jgi:hypothetical protein